MQSYGGRDQAVGFYYDKLLNAGAVDEEFAFYGFMYADKTETGFYVTGQEQKAFDYLLNCEQKGIYCTPVLLKNYWAKVAGGERQQIKRRYQFDMVETLEAMYRPAFFEVIAKLQAIPSSDAALSILNEWKTQLDSHYDMDVLHLYKATVSMAVQMKLLTSHTAEGFVRWAEGLERQLMMDELQQEGDAHIFAGLAYLDTDGETIRYLQFGKYYMAWQKRQRLMLEGKLVSPVFQKELYYSAVDFRIVQQKKQEFEVAMREQMGEAYFQCLKQLYGLPPVMEKEEYQQLAESVKQQCNDNEKTAFQLYGAQLRMTL